MRRFEIAGVARFVAAATIAMVFCGQMAKADVLYTFDGSSMSPAFTASVDLNVAGGQAVSGTGTIDFGGNIFDLTLITPSTPGNEGGPVGFRDNHGTDIFGADTVVPIDGSCCGLLFAITNNPVWGQDALFNVWSNGGNSYGFLFSGTLPGIFDVWINQGEGTGTVAAVPEASTWAMMLIGFAGLAFAANRQRRKPSVMAA